MSGGVVSGDGYCPLPMPSTSPFISSIPINQTTQVTISGAAMDQFVAADVNGPGSPSVSIVSQTFTEIVLDITCDTVGAHSLLLEGLCGDLSYSFNAAAITVLVPGDNANWVNVVGSTVGVGTLTVPNGSGWNKGASFGTVPAGADFTLSYNIDPATQPFVMVGMTNQPPGDVDQNWPSIGIKTYHAGASVNVYRGNQFQGQNGTNAGNTLATDLFELRRVGSTISLLKNGVTYHTDNTAWTSAMVFDTSAFRNVSMSNIKLEYT